MFQQETGIYPPGFSGGYKRLTPLLSGFILEKYSTCLHPLKKAFLADK
jgi:hypothetical protein